MEILLWKHTGCQPTLFRSMDYNTYIVLDYMCVHDITLLSDVGPNTTVGSLGA